MKLAGPTVRVLRDGSRVWGRLDGREIELDGGDRIAADDATFLAPVELDTRALAALGRSTGGVELQAADERRREHIAGLARLHETHDLLLTPTLGEPPIRVGALDTPAPLKKVTEGLLRTRTTRLMRLGGVIDQLVERNLAWVPYTQLANVTGRPAISLPLHTTPDGLPMGVQLVGRLRSEELLLRLARQLEQAVPWADRRPPVV